MQISFLFKLFMPNNITLKLFNCLTKSLAIFFSDSFCCLPAQFNQLLSDCLFSLQYGYNRFFLLYPISLKQCFVCWFYLTNRNLLKPSLFCFLNTFFNKRFFLIQILQFNLGFKFFFKRLIVSINHCQMSL